VRHGEPVDGELSGGIPPTPLPLVAPVTSFAPESTGPGAEMSGDDGVVDFGVEGSESLEHPVATRRAMTTAALANARHRASCSGVLILYSFPLAPGRRHQIGARRPPDRLVMRARRIGL
jgi:hypothetical protein